MHYNEKQLTSGNKGHFLNSAQCFSPDGQWIVYDTRNDDTQIVSTGSIEMVNIHSGEIKELYRTQNQTEYGPGVGAAAFSPVEEKVIFIHGIINANQDNPYSFSRRTGVAIDVDIPNVPHFMDARCITPPFIAGALRGGTHAHIWSADGQYVSFTYNDYIIEQLSNINPAVKDLRTVGVMFPHPVTVPDGHEGEDNNGEMYAVVIANVTENPKPGSDEIDKAFDETWIGNNGYQKSDGTRQKRAIAFQGNVLGEAGKSKTEVFVTDLPDDLTRAQAGQPLEGTATTRPGVSEGVTQRRLTFSQSGVTGPRHWLKTTPDGDLICFLSKDDLGFINIFGVHPNGGEVKQITYNKFDVQSGFSISPNGKLVSYIADYIIIISDMLTGKSNRITTKVKPTGKVVWSPDGKMLAFNSYVKEENHSYYQIILLTSN